MNALEYDLTVGSYDFLHGSGRRHGERRQVAEPVAVECRTVDRRTRGRPSRVVGQRSGRRREIRLTADEDRALQILADEYGVTVAALIRDAVNGFVNDAEDGRQPFPALHASALCT